MSTSRGCVANLSQPQSLNDSAAIYKFVSAAQTKNVAVVQQTIQARVDVNAYNEHGFTALHCACEEKDNEAVVSALLTAKANVRLVTKDSYERTALLRATHYNAGLKVVKMLIEAGSGTNKPSRTVCEGGNFHDEDLASAIDTFFAYSALHWLCAHDKCWNGERERIAMASYLLQHGAQPSLTFRNKMGQTPAAYAHYQNHTAVCSFYLQQEKQWRSQLVELVWSRLTGECAVAQIIVDYLLGEAETYFVAIRPVSEAEFCSIAELFNTVV